jgi:rare lipoprotein A
LPFEIALSAHCLRFTVWSGTEAAPPSYSYNSRQSPETKALNIRAPRKNIVLKHHINRRVIRNALMATALLTVTSGACIHPASAHANHGQTRFEGKQSRHQSLLTSEGGVRRHNLDRGVREKLFASAGLSERQVKSPAKSNVSGIASVYSDKETASGEPMDPAAMTAAHRTLPFDTEVTVINHNNGRSAVVRINDRGPYIQGRVIDLSPAAALALGIDGLASVSLIVVRDEDAPQNGQSMPALHLLSDLEGGVTQQ